MKRANPLWGAPRIHGELLKLGLEVSERTVSRWLPRLRKPPSQSWRTFLANHAGDLVSLDFFAVPTLGFRILFVFIVVAHERRRVVHFNVTSNPTALWTAQQMREAFPDDSAPRYLLRDRDGIYGEDFREQVAAMGIREVLTTARSPWQNPFAERLIGSIRRECLDHVIALNRRHLRRILISYSAYDHGARPQLGLGKDAPPCARYKVLSAARWWPFPKSADCTIATNAAPPKRRHQVQEPQKLLPPQLTIYRS
jgi:transposase InsO family protein